MAEYQAGSVDAFDRLHDALATPLRGYLLRLCRDAARADDLLQETFLQIHRSRAAHTPGEPVRPWAFAIARRVFLMDRRASGRRARYEHDYVAEHGVESTVAESGDRLLARREIDAAVHQVPLEKRRPFVLHHLFGYSFKEIGERLGIAPATAKMRSSRAAGIVRAWLRGQGDE
jgi:RNA polymerase sigma-70 factor, ECF subfamily